MHKNLFFLLVFISSSLVLASDKEIIPKLTFYDNPVANAWSKVDATPDESRGQETDFLSVKNPEKFNYELAARWNPKQIELGIKAYLYLMRTGINPDSSLWKKMMVGLGFTLGYEYQVGPTFYEDLYTRVDRFYMRPEFSLKKVLLPAADYKVKNAVTPGFELEYSFYRQFNDPKLALLSVPYNEKNVPSDAEHALKGMKEKDLFSFRAALTILTSSTVLSDIVTKKFGMSGGIDFLMKGVFDVYVFRLSDQKVRLKVVHVRQKEGSIRGEIGFSPDLEILGVSLLDGKIKKIIEPELLAAHASLALNESVLVDYVLNLKDQKIRDLYDNVLTQIREYNYMGVVDPLVNFSKLTDRMISNVKALQDYDLNNDERVVNLMKVKNKSWSSSSGLKIGNALIKFSVASRSSRNNITPLQKDEKIINFNSYEQETNFSAIFSLFQKNVSTSTTIMSEDSAFKGLILTHSLTDKNFTAGDLKKEKQKLKSLMPGLMESVDFSEWEKIKEIKNAEVEFIVAFSAEAILRFPDLSEDEILKRLQNYIERFGDRYLAYAGPNHQADNVARVIRKIVNTKLPLEKRLAGLVTLQNFTQYKDVLPGFLAELCPSKDFLSYSLRMGATNGSTIRVPFGNQEPINDFRKWRLLNDHTNKGETEIRHELSTFTDV
jgi:beta-lactamase class D